ncbi:MAG TPA: hypothetical protein VGX92_13300 [Pyrinomonadaceae bacterium]|jgi:hypothetical protein|nr:hypothetical protein [Pyrinomonadaceae bacterium]
MIDQVDRRLEDWIGSTLDQVEVSLLPPGESATGRGVNLYLMELINNPPARGLRRPPVQMMLRYLVMTRADKPEDAHRMLGDLVIAALENPEFEVELEPLPVAVWTAFGVAPRPCFVLRVPLRHERPEKLAPSVKHPLVVKQSPLRSLHGQVLGPESIPIMNARVELPALQLSTRTDSRGRFHFSAVPAEPRVKLLRVLAKGREYSITTEQAERDHEPFVINLQMEG